MTKREIALAEARLAGYHSDSRHYVRLIVESRVARPLLNAAYAAGDQARRMGLPCGCQQCKATT